MGAKGSNLLAVVEGCKVGLPEDVESLPHTQFAYFGHRVEWLAPVQYLPAHFVC